LSFQDWQRLSARADGDARGQWPVARDTVVKRYRKATEAEVIGKTDFDSFPPHIAEGFLRDDRGW